MIKLTKIKLKSSYLLFLIPLLASFKCVKEPTEYVYKTLDMNLANANTSGTGPLVVENSVPKNAYGIRIQLTFSSPKVNHDYKTHRNEDSVTEFVITSSEGFNGIAPGNSLNHLFSFRKNANQFVGISPESYTNIFSISDENTSDNYLFLAQSPNTPGDYTFHLSATFSDGRVLSKSVSVNLHQ
ncbi:MAG: hypothetical protein ACO1N0_09470 [Fluviicola sp.]